MYIKYNDKKYPCSCRPARTLAFRGLPEDFPAPVTGELVLCADDGFVLRKDNADDYLRQTFEGGVLVLTNTPEPLEPEEPAEPAPTLRERVAVLEESSAEMTEALDLLLSGVTE